MVLIGLLYAWIGYPMTISLMAPTRRCVKTPATDKSSDWPHITLLISAYNEEAVLPNKLENALALDYPTERLEVMVVSDASTDRTDEIATAFAKRGVRLLRQPLRKGKTAALNLAVPKAEGELVVFTDADALFIPSALKRLARAFDDPATGFVSGRTVYIHHTEAVTVEASNLYTKLEIFTKVRESRLGSCVGADGAIFAIRKALYQPLDTVDINDFVIPLQIITQGYKGKLIPQAVCIEEASTEDAQAFDRQVRITNRTLRAIIKCRELLNPFRYPLFAFCLVSHKLMKFASPFFLLGMLLSNLVLVGHGIWFTLSIVGQGLFYGMTIFVALFPDYRRIRLLGIAFTFCLTNAAMLKGWITFLRGRTYTTWLPGRA